MINKRQRFYIDIKPNHTAFVSWRKLLHDNAPPPPPPFHLSYSRSNDKSKVRQQDSSFLKGEKPGHRTRVKSSDNKQRVVPNIEFPKVEAKFNDNLEDRTKAYRLAAESAQSRLQSRLQKYLNCPVRPDTSSFAGDRNLEGLHDVPVTYSRRTSSIMNYWSVNVADGTSLFPLKTKHNFVEKTQKLCSEKSRMHTKAENGPSGITSQGSSRVFGPLRTYQRSRNSVDRWLSKATTKTNATRDTDPHNFSPSSCHEAAHKKEVIKGSTLLPKSSHHAKSSVTSKPSTKQPLSKGPNMEVPGKRNVKIEFPLKPDQDIRNSS